jgi:GNAT superfamily N-acetyltransferase
MPPTFDVRIRHTVTPDDVSMVTQLWIQLGWGPEGVEGRERVQQAFAGSSWVAVAELEGQFAGYARALSDRVMVTYLAEVAVVPTLRRKGVGGTLIQSCLSAFRHTAVYADAAPEIVALNARYGLVPRSLHLTACARGPQQIEDSPNFGAG